MRGCDSHASHGPSLFGAEREGVDSQYGGYLGSLETLAGSDSQRGSMMPFHWTVQSSYVAVAALCLNFLSGQDDNAWRPCGELFPNF